MKKIMMSLAALAVAATMNAQGYIGGTLGLDFENKMTDKNGKDATAMSFTINPELGYNLSDQSSVGILLGFGTTNNSNEVVRSLTNIKGVNTNMKLDKSLITFEIAPYYRYKFLQLGKVDIFLDAQVGFKYMKYDDDHVSNFNIGVRPGVAFNASEKVSFVAKLGKGLFYESSKPKNGETQSSFGLNANSLAALEIGMYFGI
mgnify:CR=1 FL=1